MKMDVVQCVKTLEGQGFMFYLESDGKIKIKQPPERNPFNDNLMAWLKANKQELRELLAARQPQQAKLVLVSDVSPLPDTPQIDLLGVGYDKARQVADLIDDGKAVLVDKVRYHARTDKYDIRYREVEP